MKAKRAGQDSRKIGFASEEYCAECEAVFDTPWVTSKCPKCGEEVTSCNACVNHDECGKCLGGSQFSLVLKPNRRKK